MEITFYYRENCHLCDAMRKALVAFDRKVYPVVWREVDIDRDIRLVQQYDSKVPVLCKDGSEICHYFLDENALVSALV
ncbi:MAG: glutaredoxin family protein [Gammaproteobacteria bacterium]|nr:glutaredoxin family protein [Gammaproteobacteria bacterium]